MKDEPATSTSGETSCASCSSPAWGPCREAVEAAAAHMHEPEYFSYGNDHGLPSLRKALVEKISTKNGLKGVSLSFKYLYGWNAPMQASKVCGFRSDPIKEWAITAIWPLKLDDGIQHDLKHLYSDARCGSDHCNACQKRCVGSSFNVT